ncbi:MAG TPA: hypothetical protein VFX48_00770, partial [Saprospiraceae bacterium]|nr:hypothetical protein [Saprospiraceae bacterium]
MIFTLLCLVCTTLLGILFKLAGQQQLRSYAIIPVNYAFCFLMGFVHIGTALFTQMSMDWLPHAFLLGVFFIAGFNIFARTIAVAGLPLAAMFQKMSIILTVLAALWLGDRLNAIQFIGLLAGIVSIVLALGKPIDQIPHRGSYYRLLLLTLLLSATIEI